MEKRTLLTIRYSSGRELRQLVKRIAYEGGRLTYTQDAPGNVLAMPVYIPLESITEFEAHTVECNGFTICGEEGNP